MSMLRQTLLFAALATLAALAAQAETAPRGTQLAYTCYGCHGIPDYRNAYPTYHVPKLAGQHPEYLYAALTEYKSGARKHPTMSGQAGSFDEASLRALAATLATAKPAASSGHPVGTAPAAASVCQACHGSDGVGVQGDYPTLSGQYADYLVQALKAYRDGKRQNPIMQGMAANLKDADIAALAAYFSRQSGLDVREPPSRPGE
jgi:cytochrome c553